MNREEIRQDLKAFIDGELSQERTQQIKEAVENDPELQKELEFMKKISLSLKELKHGPQPTGFEKISRKINYPKKSLLSWQMKSAIAVVFLAVISVASIPILFKNSSVELADSISESPKDSTPNLEGDKFRTLSGETSAGVSESSSPQFGFDESLSQKNSSDHESKEPNRTDSSLTHDVYTPQREIIRTASLTLLVDKIEASEKTITSLVKSWGGYVETTQSTNLDKTNPRLIMTVRVPVAKFDQALEEFEGIGVRQDKTISGEDVTAHLADLDARIKNMKAQEETYRQILRQAKRIGEILEIQQQLTYIRNEIESIEAQRKVMRSLASLSTISITLQQRPSEDERVENPGWAEDTWISAKNAFLGLIKILSIAAIYTFVFIPIWAPAIFFTWYLSKKVGNK
jgi:hypothetical protein